MVSSSNPSGRSGANSISKALQGQKSSMERLSSGKSINKASDDPAGLAVLSQLDASVVSLGQASKNISDSSSALSVADGASSQIQNMTGRLQELATQAANGTISDSQRGALQQEFSALTQEIQRVGKTTEFNGIKPLDGGSFTTQVGTDSSSSSQIQSSGINVGDLVSNVASQDISTQAGAQAALSAVTDFSDSLSQARGEDIGSVQSRLESAQSTVETQAAGTQEAASRIGDANVAEEAANLAKNGILAQVSTALQTQAANLDRNRVKALLG
jgi:flagellin